MIVCAWSSSALTLLNLAALAVGRRLRQCKQLWGIFLLLAVIAKHRAFFKRFDSPSNNSQSIIMNSLDCESIESTERSLCGLRNISLSALRQCVNELTKQDFQIDTDIDNDRCLPMLKYVADCTVRDYEAGSTCFFHATRVPHDSVFRAGIRSLPNQIDWTWSFLYSLVSDEINEIEWRRFRQEVERNHYGRLPDVNTAWMAKKGPCAFLFAETPLKPDDTGSHDYFAISELTEDISQCFKRDFEREYGINLCDKFHTATKPFLVKFTVQGILAFRIGRALAYLVHRKAGRSLGYLDSGFSGEGRSIPPEQISKVMPIEEFSVAYTKTSVYSISSPTRHLLVNQGVKS